MDFPYAGFGSEELPDISVEKTKASLVEMKNKKSLGGDGIPIEVINEKVVIFCSVFIFEKAFDSAKHWSIIFLEECRVDSRYSNSIQNIYKMSKTPLKYKFKIERGVRRCDTSSQKLFTSTLGSVLK